MANVVSLVVYTSRQVPSLVGSLSQQTCYCIRCCPVKTSLIQSPNPMDDISVELSKYTAITFLWRCIVSFGDSINFSSFQVTDVNIHRQKATLV